MLLWDDVGTSLGNLTCSRGDHEIVLVVTKLPGTVNGSPYTSSVDEACTSCLGAARIPSKKHGNSSIQMGPVNLAFKDVFIVLCKRSTNPLYVE